MGTDVYIRTLEGSCLSPQSPSDNQQSIHKSTSNSRAPKHYILSTRNLPVTAKMKLTTLLLTLFFAMFVVANPMAAPQDEPEAEGASEGDGSLGIAEDGAFTAQGVATCTVAADALKCRTGPTRKCKALRQYPRGTKLRISCARYGEKIKGNP